MCRGLLASGELGQNRGLPVAVIASTTVKELAEWAGPAATAGGSLLPIRDLVRMAAHAQHYLSVFDDDGRALYLARGKRVASADQRIVLHAKDRGCSFPACDRPGYLTEAHHLHEWSEGGPTDITNLTFVCHAHHRLIGTGEHQWRTRRGWGGGRTEWVPPCHLDPGRHPRTNRYHHPERSLRSEREPERSLRSEREPERSLRSEREPERSLRSEREPERSLAGVDPP
jgi:hypothetical protein